MVFFSNKDICSLHHPSLVLGWKHEPDQEATQTQCLFYLLHTLENDTGKALGSISGLQHATGAAPVSQGDPRVVDAEQRVVLWEDCAHCRSRVWLHIPQPWVTWGCLLTPNPTPAPGIIFLPHFCGRECLLKEEWWKAITEVYKTSLLWGHTVPGGLSWRWLTKGLFSFHSWPEGVERNPKSLLIFQNMWMAWCNNGRDLQACKREVSIFVV